MRRSLVLATAVIASVWAFAASASAATAELVSVSSDGKPANRASGAAMVSADGRFVVFASLATNLSTMADTNRRWDVFVRDLFHGTTRRVSVSNSGGQSNAATVLATISGDGRIVAFSSEATNLVARDENRSADVFVRDRTAHTTRLVSLSNTGAPGNRGSGEPVISRDGRYVAFVSAATNLVAGDTNDQSDIFVRDLAGKTTVRVNVSTSGAQMHDDSFLDSISAHGRFVLFTSAATDLVPGDTNGYVDLFVRDRRLETTRRVDVSTTGAQANARVFSASLSANGRFAVFDTIASNLVPHDTNGNFDIFLRDLILNRTVRVSVPRSGAQANGGSELPRVSSDGRYVTFDSGATNLDPPDAGSGTDIFLRDRVANTTELVSRSTNGVQANHASNGATLSDDGQLVAFNSDATNLDPRVAVEREEIYIRRR